VLKNKNKLCQFKKLSVFCNSGLETFGSQLVLKTCTCSPPLSSCFEVSSNRITSSLFNSLQNHIFNSMYSEVVYTFHLRLSLWFQDDNYPAY
jgi:hypothetical protein